MESLEQRVSDLEREVAELKSQLSKQPQPQTSESIIAEIYEKLKNSNRF